MDVEVNFVMTRCARKFIAQCSAWQAFTLTSVSISVLAAITFIHLGITGWDLVTKIFITLGCVTCLFWWIWVMQRIKDIATWWAELHTTIEQTSILLSDTKADIASIKKITKQENSLFG